jgi:hypothetical protein
MISDLLNSKVGQIIISVILGFGLATIFRKVCTGKSCLVVKGPSLDDVKKYYYKIEDDCFKYTPYTTKCDDASATKSG